MGKKSRGKGGDRSGKLKPVNSVSNGKVEGDEFAKVCISTGEMSLFMRMSKGGVDDQAILHTGHCLPQWVADTSSAINRMKIVESLSKVQKGELKIEAGKLSGFCLGILRKDELLTDLTTRVQVMETCLDMGEFAEGEGEQLATHTDLLQSIGDMRKLLSLGMPLDDRLVSQWEKATTSVITANLNKKDSLVKNKWMGVSIGMKSLYIDSTHQSREQGNLQSSEVLVESVGSAAASEVRLPTEAPRDPASSGEGGKKFLELKDVHSSLIRLQDSFGRTKKNLENRKHEVSDMDIVCTCLRQSQFSTEPATRELMNSPAVTLHLFCSHVFSDETWLEFYPKDSDSLSEALHMVLRCWVITTKHFDLEQQKQPETFGQVSDIISFLRVSSERVNWDKWSDLSCGSLVKKCHMNQCMTMLCNKISANLRLGARGIDSHTGWYKAAGELLFFCEYLMKVQPSRILRLGNVYEELNDQLFVFEVLGALKSEGPEAALLAAQNKGKACLDKEKRVIPYLIELTLPHSRLPAEAGFTQEGLSCFRGLLEKWRSEQSQGVSSASFRKLISKSDPDSVSATGRADSSGSAGSTSIRSGDSRESSPSPTESRVDDREEDSVVFPGQADDQTSGVIVEADSQPAKEVAEALVGSPNRLPEDLQREVMHVLVAETHQLQTKIAELEAASDAKIAGLEAASDAEIVKLKAEIAALRAAEKAKLKAGTAERAELKAASDAKIAELEAASDAKIAELEAASDAKIAGLEAASDAEIVKLKAEIAALRAAEKAKLKAGTAERAELERKTLALKEQEIKAIKSKKQIAKLEVSISKVGTAKAEAIAETDEARADADAAKKEKTAAMKRAETAGARTLKAEEKAAAFKKEAAEARAEAAAVKEEATAAKAEATAAEKRAVSLQAGFKRKVSEAEAQAQAAKVGKAAVEAKAESATAAAKAEAEAAKEEATAAKAEAEAAKEEATAAKAEATAAEKQAVSLQAGLKRKVSEAEAQAQAAKVGKAAAEEEAAQARAQTAAAKAPVSVITRNSIFPDVGNHQGASEPTSYPGSLGAVKALIEYKLGKIKSKHEAACKNASELIEGAGRHSDVNVSLYHMGSSTFWLNWTQSCLENNDIQQALNLVGEKLESIDLDIHVIVDLSICATSEATNEIRLKKFFKYIDDGISRSAGMFAPCTPAFRLNKSNGHALVQPLEPGMKVDWLFHREGYRLLPVDEISNRAACLSLLDVGACSKIWNAYFKEVARTTEDGKYQMITFPLCDKLLDIPCPENKLKICRKFLEHLRDKIDVGSITQEAAKNALKQVGEVFEILAKEPGHDFKEMCGERSKSLITEMLRDEMVSNRKLEDLRTQIRSASISPIISPAMASN